MSVAVLAALMMQAVPASDAFIPKPDWERVPPAEAFMRYYPKAAQQQELAGRASLGCSVTTEGRLEACSVVEETPADAGFGAAALQLAPLFKMRPMAKDGQPVSGGAVRIPIRFQLPADLTAGPIPLPSTVFKGAVVGLDCRYRAQRLDNCLVSQAAQGKPDASEVAIKAAEAMALPPLPRAHGRMRLTIRLGEAPPVTAAQIVAAPDWVRKPTGEHMAGVYPARAMSGGIQGYATTQCIVTEAGLLADCETLDENPPYVGFGDAALKLMKLFKMRPVTKDGRPVTGGVVRIPIRFGFAR